MRISVFLVLSPLSSVCIAQKNYYKIVDDTVYNENGFKNYFEERMKSAPKDYKYRSIIFHKIVLKDSLINYVYLEPKKLDPKIENKDIEFIFRQDPSFLFLNKKLPEFILEDVYGKTFNSTKLIGKPTMINFWSVYCGHCIIEFSELNKLKAKYSDKINFIAICDSPLEQTKEILNKKPFDFTTLIDNKHYRLYTLKITGIPRNFFLDKNGTLREIS
jgi:thiol-disulfide isomerase/thioredoxin